MQTRILLYKLCPYLTEYYSAAAMLDYRSLFTLPEDLHFINCAFSAPMSKRVAAAADKALKVKCNPANFEVADFFEPADRVRSLFSEILGSGKPERTAIIPSTSYAFATITSNLKATGSQKVIVVEEQFPSSIYSWRRFASRTGCRVETISRSDGNLGGDGWNNRLLEAIDDSTVAVSIPHVHWTDGVMFDLEAIGARAREVGALFVIDGTQSVGALDLGFDKAKPDAVICAGYKWLTGTMGLGAAYYGPAFDNGIPLEENWITRKNSSDFTGLVDYIDEYSDGMVRYDVGERGISLLLPMFVAALEQVREWGAATIQEHCHRITKQALLDLEELGCSVPSAGSPRHLFGIRLPVSVDRTALIDELRHRNVIVSLRSDAVRVSPHLYNHEGDLQALVDAFKAAKRSKH